MNKFIFLDIDGVVNDAETYDIAPYGGKGIDDHHLYQLKHIIDITKAEIILTSDWRYNSPEWRGRFPEWKTSIQDWEYMNQKFENFGLKIGEITKDACTLRGNEIKMFLLRQPGPVQYVILDDLPLDDFLPEQQPHIVQTNPLYGLTNDDVTEALRKMQIIEEKI